MNWVLLVLAVAAAAIGAASSLGTIHLPIPAPAAFAVAGLCALLLALRLLPRMIRRPAVFLVTLLALGGLAGGLYYFQFVIKPNMVKGFLAAAFAPKPTAVAVETAGIDKWPPRMSAIGSVRAFQGIDVAPQVAGDVRAIHFKSGEDVAAGVLLIEIDDSVEQADLKNGLAQLRNAELSLERQQTLAAGGNAAKAQVDAALATRDSSSATVDHARAIIAQKAITAPFAGRLGIAKVDIGQFVSVGTSLVTFQQLDPIYVDFQMPEEGLNRLAIGQQATMTVDAYPDRNFVGKVTAIDARVNLDTRNVLVRAEFENADRKLLPGMFANIEVTTGAPADVLTLSRTAIVYSLYGDNIFVVKPAPPKAGEAQAASTQPTENLVVERRFVRLGDARGDRVAVLEGVKPGERVVTAGQIKLQNNSPVVIDPAGALPLPAQPPKP
jgi:RND family efflux transporter MFP subunit